MLKIEIPGKGILQIQHLVLDFNGTIAVDGKLISGISERIKELSQYVNIYVITADTNGTVHKQCEHLPVEVHVIGKQNQELEKEHFVNQLSPKGTASMGNGTNDERMFQASDVSIAIIGTEGCATRSLLQSDIVVHNILDGFDLFLKQHRLIATLRK